MTTKCTFCRKEGYNRSTCKEAPPSTKRRLGRPMKASTEAQQTPSKEQQLAKPTQQSKQRTKVRCVYKSRHTCGMGITIDNDTGRMLYNPGMSSEMVIHEGTVQEYMAHYANVQTNFPIPNENDITKDQAAASTAPVGSRKIRFRGKESVSQPSPSSVKPFGLKWKGKPSITSSQLQLQTQKMMTRSKSHSSKPTI